MEIILLVALVILNGLFAMSEIALVTARRARLAKLADDGDGAAVIAMKLGEDPTRFLSTIQIGITSIGILNGIVGEAALAGPLALWLQTFGVDQRASEVGATVLVVVVITYVSIVVGELVPKRIGQINPEGIARLVARPMNMLSVASRPFVHLLSTSTAIILRLMGQRDSKGPSVTEEEIHAMLVEGSAAGVIEKDEHEMVRNVFRLDDRQISSLMVPRSDIIWLDVARLIDENHAAHGGIRPFPLSRRPRRPRRDSRHRQRQADLQPDAARLAGRPDAEAAGAGLCAGVADRHGVAGSVPHLGHADGFRHRRVRRGTGHDHLAGPDRIGHRRIQADEQGGRLGRAARGWLMAARRPDSAARVEGPAGHEDRARGGQGPLPHALRHADAAARAPAGDRRPATAPSERAGISRSSISTASGSTRSWRRRRRNPAQRQRRARRR